MADFVDDLFNQFFGGGSALAGGGRGGARGAHHRRYRGVPKRALQDILALKGILGQTKAAEIAAILLKR